MHESYQKIRLTLNISWEPGSQVPCEYAALHTGAKTTQIGKYHAAHWGLYQYCNVDLDLDLS